MWRFWEGEDNLGSKIIAICLITLRRADLKKFNLPENLKEEKGPLSKLRRSYNFTLSELMPAAKIRPSGSNAATGLPARCINPWQLADLRSHKRIVLSKEPLKNESSVGDIHRETTRLLCPRK